MPFQTFVFCQSHVTGKKTVKGEMKDGLEDKRRQCAEGSFIYVNTN